MIMSVNTIMKKLSDIQSEVKLKSEKVMLGTAEDLAKADAVFKDAMTKATAEIAKLKASDDAIAKAKADAEKVVSLAQTSADKAQLAADKVAASLQKTIDNAVKVLDKIDAIAKDLGVQPSSVNGYKETEQMFLTAEESIKKIKNYSFQND
jgi:ABC-type transporter Mla subunit MlaD